MKLYVDDLRKCPKGWHLARTNTDAIRLLSFGHVEEISIDHDIVAYCKHRPSVPMADETFQPVAYYIAAMPAEIRPKKVTIHTANPAGALRMQGVLKDAGIESEYKEGSYNFEWGEDVK